MMNKTYRLVIVTYVLLVINILIYIAQLSLGINLNMVLEALDWGVNFAPFTLNSESWRLISSMFIHFNPYHIIANMYTLYIIGRSLEREVGSLNFAVIYFATGIIGGLISISWNLYTLSAGASGALFGVYGFEIILLLNKNRKDNSVIQGIILNFLIYLGITLLLGNRFRFDNACHFGGLFSGILLAFVYVAAIKYYSQYKQAVLVCLSIITITTVSYFIPNYQLKYFNAFQAFILAENETRNAFNAKHSDPVLVEELRKVKLIYDSTLYLIDSIEYLPNKIQHDTDILRKIINAHEREFNHVYTIINNESYIYYDSIWFERMVIRTQPKLNFPLNLSPPLPKDTTHEQSGNSFPVKVYYDQDWRISTAINASYWREGIKDSLDRWNGPVTDYYMSGQIQMKGSYKKDIKDGVFIYYHENGKYDGAGRVKDDYNIGKWEYFYEDGQIHREVRYTDRVYLINAWDEYGLPTVIHGEGEIRERHANGVTSHFSKYNEGLKDSLSFGFYDNGLPYFREWYINGVLTSGVSYNELGERSNYDFSTYIPHPVGGGDKLFEYIAKEKNKLELLQTDTANLKVVFQVFEDGQPDNIRVLYTDNKRLINIAKDIIKNGPNWFPARDHGIMVTNTETSVNIRFP